MGAKPSVVSATGFVGNATDVWLMCLFENKASLGYTKGMTNFIGAMHDISKNICYKDETNSRITCINPTYYNLKNKTTVLVNMGKLFDYGCIESYGCSSGDDCSNRTCTTWGSRISFVTDIPVVAKSSSQPSSPAPITITPGNSTLTIGWKPVSDPTGISEVFAYYVVILYSGSPVISGYVEAGVSSTVIGGLTNGRTYTVQVQAVSHNNVISSSATATGTPVGATNPLVYNIETIPESPKAAESVTIKASLANTGPNGKVRAVFKLDGTQISDQNSTLNTYPGGGLWQPTASYTMPNKTITIAIEAYGWDGSNWVLTDSNSITRTPSAPSCTGVTLLPFSASIKEGEKVTFTASVTPSTSPFTVEFKDRTGTLLSTCTTTEGNCTFIWDATGKSPDTYYVKAYVKEGGCQSTESTVQVSPAVRQWTINVYVKDSVTNNPVDGAAVTVGMQSKSTDTTGLSQFIVDEGTLSIAISKTGYNSFSTFESVFSNKTFNYVISAIGSGKGSIQFVTVPADADVYLDGNKQGKKTPVTITDVPVGLHTYVLKLTGYNDFTGNVTVIMGEAVKIEASLIPAEGCVYFNISPSGGRIFIDNVDTKHVTPTLICGLRLGLHDYRIVLYGYKEITGRINLTAGKGTVIKGTFEKAGIGAGTVLGVAILGFGALGIVAVTRKRKSQPQKEFMKSTIPGETKKNLVTNR